MPRSGSRDVSPSRGKSPRRGKPKRTKSGEKDLRRTKSGENLSRKNPDSGKKSSGRTGNSDGSVRSERTSGTRYSESTQVLSNIPKEYLSKPDKAEPILYYLPKASNNNNNDSFVAAGGNIKSTSAFPSLRVLLAAAQDDIRLHRARQQAGKYRDPKLLSTYKIENDDMYLTRQQRLHERELLLGKLDMERKLILKELLEGNTSGLTAKEATAIQLARWQRALELYVYDPPNRRENAGNLAGASDAGGTSGAQSTQLHTQEEQHNLGFLHLLEKLREIIGEVSKGYCYNIDFFQSVFLTQNILVDIWIRCHGKRKWSLQLYETPIVFGTPQSY